MVHTFASLRLRDYRLLWLGQVSTSMGQWMDQVTRGWLIYHLTGSALSLGLAAAMRGLPLLFFGILAGAVADRSGRKAQLVIAQVTNALLAQGHAASTPVALCESASLPNARSLSGSLAQLPQLAARIGDASRLEVVEGRPLQHLELLGGLGRRRGHLVRLDVGGHGDGEQVHDRDQPGHQDQDGDQRLHQREPGLSALGPHFALLRHGCVQSLVVIFPPGWMMIWIE